MLFGIMETHPLLTAKAYIGMELKESFLGGQHAVFGMEIVAIQTLVSYMFIIRLCITGLLKYSSQERNYLFYECSPHLGFIMSKKQERLRSELLSEDKITNLLVFLT